MSRSNWLMRKAFFLLFLVLVASATNLEGHERQASRLRSSFRPVVEEVSKSTVKILADGKSAALGAVVDAKGLIVTKASEIVAKDAAKPDAAKGDAGSGDVSIEVVLQDGARYAATTVGVDRTTDLALLHINATDLTPIRWASKANPATGGFIATPGIDLDPVGVGVISVEPRPIPGGALGVQLDDYGGVVIIRRVLETGGAMKAGLLPGDVITHVEGVQTKTNKSVQQSVSSHLPGESIKLSILRDSQNMDIQVTLSSFSAIIHTERAEFQNKLGGALSSRRTGFPMVLQHDTVLQPSECGGPIVDLDGRAVGLNIARAGRVESYALPAELVAKTVAKLKQGEMARQALQPVTIQTSTEASPTR